MTIFILAILRYIPIILTPFFLIYIVYRLFKKSVTYLGALSRLGLWLLFVIFVHALPIWIVQSGIMDAPYTEKRPENFVLSEETPISIGHGVIGRSLSTEPVDILSSGTHFRIPRNYIEMLLHNKRDGTVNFTLVTLFPDFKGVQSGAEDGKLTEENKIWRWMLSPNLVEMITIGDALGKKSENDYNTEVFNSESGETHQPWKYGLLKSKKSLNATLQDVYFQLPTKTSKGHVIFCDKDDELKRCQVYIRASDGLLILLRYHRELLPHWQEIDSRATQLINSFIVKEE